MYSYDIKTQANSRITLSLNKRKRIEIIHSPGQIVHSLNGKTFEHIIIRGAPDISSSRLVPAGTDDKPTAGTGTVF